jgi:tetratricopeptide (TPR) repeat protein
VSQAKDKLLKGDYEGAIQDLNKAISINPKFARAYNDRGFAHLFMKEYSKAIADFDKAISLNPELAGAYVSRAFGHIQIGNKQQAKQDLQIAAHLFRKQGNMADHDKAMKQIDQLENR